MAKKNRGNMQKRLSRPVEDGVRLVGMGGVGGSFRGDFHCQTCDKQVDDWCEVGINGRPLLVCFECSKRLLGAAFGVNLQG